MTSHFKAQLERPSVNNLDGFCQFKACLRIRNPESATLKKQTNLQNKIKNKSSVQYKCVYLPSHKANRGDFWAKMAVKKRENSKEGRSVLRKHFASDRAQGANTTELLKEGRGREQGGVLNGLQFYIFLGGEDEEQSLMGRR